MREIERLQKQQKVITTEHKLINNTELKALQVILHTQVMHYSIS